MISGLNGENLRKVILFFSSNYLSLQICTLKISNHSISKSITARRGRTGLVVRASDSGSRDPGSILSRVGVLFP